MLYGMTRLLSGLRTTGRVLATVSVLAMAFAGGAPMALAQEQPAPAVSVPEPGIAESVAAIVNDDIISSYDLVQRMRLVILTTGFQPTNETIPQIQQMALQQLIEERLKLQELRHAEKENKMTIVLTDKEVDEVVSQIVQGEYKMSEDQFYGLLKQQGINPATYREQIRIEQSWGQYINGRYGGRMRIGEDQVAATRKRMAEAAARPQYQLSEIYIDANAVGGMQVAYQGAQQLIAQMQQGAPFPAVARQFSASATAAAGGDAGWVSPGEMPPQVDAALEQLRPGQLSAPIATDQGVYIIYLKEKRAGGSKPLVTLKQAAVSLDGTADQAAVDAAAASLEKLRALNPTCTDLEAKAGQVPGVIAGDMGEMELTDLTGDFAEAATNTPENQLSAKPIRTDIGVHLVMVCGKRTSGGALPTSEQIERRLRSQQLDMVSRRVLRDLRTQATIEVR